MAFDAASCELFISECGNEKYTQSQLFQMVIGVDGNGCPVIKTKQSGDVLSGLTLDHVEGATLADLVTAFNAYKAAHPDRIIKYPSTLWNGAAHVTTFFY